MKDVRVLKGRKSEKVILRAKSASRITKDKDGYEFDIPATSFSPFKGVFDFVQKYLRCECRFVKDGFSSFCVSEDGKKVSYLLRVLKRDSDTSSKEVCSPMYVKAVFDITDNFAITDKFKVVGAKKYLATIYSEIKLFEVTSDKYFNTLTFCEDCFRSSDSDFQKKLLYFVKELDEILGRIFTERRTIGSDVLLFSVILKRFGYRFMVYEAGKTTDRGYVSDGYRFDSGFLADFNH